MPLWKCLKVNNSNFLSLFHIKPHFFCIYESLWQFFVCMLCAYVCACTYGFWLISYFLCLYACAYGAATTRFFYLSSNSFGIIFRFPFRLFVLRFRFNVKFHCRQMQTKTINEQNYTYIVVDSVSSYRK